MFQHLVPPRGQLQFRHLRWGGGWGEGRAAGQEELLPFFGELGFSSPLLFREDGQAHDFYPPVVTSCHDTHSREGLMLLRLRETSPKAPGSPFASCCSQAIFRGVWEVNLSMYFPGLRFLKITSPGLLILATKQNQNPRQPEPAARSQAQHSLRVWAFRRTSVQSSDTDTVLGAFAFSHSLYSSQMFPLHGMPPTPSFIWSRWSSKKSRSRSCKRLKEKKRQ